MVGKRKKIGGELNPLEQKIGRKLNPLERKLVEVKKIYTQKALVLNFERNALNLNKLKREQFDLLLKGLNFKRLSLMQLNQLTKKAIELNYFNKKQLTLLLKKIAKAK